ncbi:hypothetical protein DFJ73DRAFT_770864 [Zopfochytrium polystomum]|nr:hypothetical protein DFJ73DRAFT_770864 [Zopfochytrium polystomum]
MRKERKTRLFLRNEKNAVWVCIKGYLSHPGGATLQHKGVNLLPEIEIDVSEYENAGGTNLTGAPHIAQITDDSDTDFEKYFWAATRSGIRTLLLGQLGGGFLKGLLSGDVQHASLAMNLSKFVHEHQWAAEMAFVHVPYMKPVRIDSRSLKTLEADLRIRTQEVKSLKDELRSWNSRCAKWHLKDSSVQKLLDLYGSKVLPKVRAEEKDDAVLLAAKAVSSGHLDLGRFQYNFVCTQFKMYTINNLVGKAAASLFSAPGWAKWIYIYSKLKNSCSLFDSLNGAGFAGLDCTQVERAGLIVGSAHRLMLEVPVNVSYVAALDDMTIGAPDPVSFSLYQGQFLHAADVSSNTNKWRKFKKTKTYEMPDDGFLACGWRDILEYTLDLSKELLRAHTRLQLAYNHELQAFERQSRTLKDVFLIDVNRISMQSQHQVKQLLEQIGQPHAKKYPAVLGLCVYYWLYNQCRNQEARLGLTGPEDHHYAHIQYDSTDFLPQGFKLLLRQLISGMAKSMCSVEAALVDQAHYVTALAVTDRQNSQTSVYKTYMTSSSSIDQTRKHFLDASQSMAELGIPITSWTTDGATAQVAHFPYNNSTPSSFLAVSRLAAYAKDTKLHSGKDKTSRILAAADHIIEKVSDYIKAPEVICKCNLLNIANCLMQKKLEALNKAVTEDIVSDLGELGGPSTQADLREVDDDMEMELIQEQSKGRNNISSFPTHQLHVEIEENNFVENAALCGGNWMGLPAILMMITCKKYGRSFCLTFKRLSTSAWSGGNSNPTAEIRPLLSVCASIHPGCSNLTTADIEPTLLLPAQNLFETTRNLHSAKTQEGLAEQEVREALHGFKTAKKDIWENAKKVAAALIQQHKKTLKSVTSIILSGKDCLKMNDSGSAEMRIWIQISSTLHQRMEYEKLCRTSFASVVEGLCQMDGLEDICNKLANDCTLKSGKPIKELFLLKDMKNDFLDVEATSLEVKHFPGQDIRKALHIPPKNQHDPSGKHLLTFFGDPAHLNDAWKQVTESDSDSQIFQEGGGIVMQWMLSKDSWPLANQSSNSLLISAITRRQNLQAQLLAFLMHLTLEDFLKAKEWQYGMKPIFLENSGQN